MDGYTCSVCGKAVIVVGEKKIRSCEHKDAPIIASMSAVATGESTLKQRK